MENSTETESMRPSGLIERFINIWAEPFADLRARFGSGGFGGTDGRFSPPVAAAGISLALPLPGPGVTAFFRTCSLRTWLGAGGSGKLIPLVGSSNSTSTGSVSSGFGQGATVRTCLQRLVAAAL